MFEDSVKSIQQFESNDENIKILKNILKNLLDIEKVNIKELLEYLNSKCLLKISTDTKQFYKRFIGLINIDSYKQQSFDEGFDMGKDQGFEDAEIELSEELIEKGKHEGFSIAQRSCDKRIDEQKNKLILSLLDNKVSDEKICKSTNVNKSELSQIKNQVFDGTQDWFIDKRDGKKYKTIKLGKLIWLSENLAFQLQKNCSVYNNKNINLDRFGLLYSWDAAIKAIPEGWHIPTLKEWQELVALFESNINKSNELVDFFTQLGGFMDGNNFQDKGEAAYYWSADEISQMHAKYLLINKAMKTFEMGNNKLSKFSVRCVKNVNN